MFDLNARDLETDWISASLLFLKLMSQSSHVQPRFKDCKNLRFIPRSKMSQKLSIPDGSSSKRAFADIEADKDKKKIPDIHIDREAKKMKATGSFDSNWERSRNWNQGDRNSVLGYWEMKWSTRVRGSGEKKGLQWFNLNPYDTPWNEYYDFVSVTEIMTTFVRFEILRQIILFRIHRLCDLIWKHFQADFYRGTINADESGFGKMGSEDCIDIRSWSKVQKEDLFVAFDTTEYIRL